MGGFGGGGDFGDAVVEIVAAGVGAADADDVGVVAIEDEVARVGAHESFEFLDDGFHFASAV